MALTARHEFQQMGNNGVTLRCPTLRTLMLAAVLALSSLDDATAQAVSVTSSDVDARLGQAYTAIDRALAKSSMPGLVVGLTDRTRLRRVFVHGYADLKARTPLNAESRFAIGSISKAFTSIALLQLEQEGRFDRQAPITHYLPALASNPRLAAVTGHHLMSHTAGLPNYLPDAASSRYVMAELQGFEPSYAPGAHWWYSNTGYQLLGYVLEDIEKAPYHTIIRRRVLDRLGMTSTSAVIDDAQRTRMVVSYAHWPYDGSYVEAPWFEYAAGDGSIVSNAADMCAYVRFILNRGMGPKDSVLSEKSFAQLTSPVLEHYAYGLMVSPENGGTLISHTGGIAGFSSEVEAHMEDGFGLVFLSNGGIDAPLQKWIIQSIEAAYHGQPLPAAPASKQGPDLAHLQDYAGLYHLVDGDASGTDGMLKIARVGGHLTLQQGGHELPLEQMGSDAFRGPPTESDGFAYFFGRGRGDHSEIVGVSHGSRWYVRNKLEVPAQAATPKEYSAFVGHYQNNGPEGPVARVFIRDGHLMMSGLEEGADAEPLEPLSTGFFRAGSPDYSPERARFDTIVDGQALRLTLSGVPLYRKDTP